MYNPLLPNDYNALKVQDHRNRNNKQHHLERGDQSELSSRVEAENNSKKSISANFLSAALRSSTAPSFLDAVGSRLSASTGIRDPFQTSNVVASSALPPPGTLPSPLSLPGGGSTHNPAAPRSPTTNTGRKDVDHEFSAARVNGNFLVPSTRLDMSAEEFHAQRIQRSARMGVQRAVDLQKDEMETEFKKRKLEGSDTKSKVSNLLSQLRQKKAAATAAKSKDSLEATAPLDAHSAQFTTVPNMACWASGVSLSAESCSPKKAVDPRDNSSLRVLSAPLAFVPSGLQSGGFVIAQTEQSRSENVLSRLEGQTSTTLLLRYVHSPSLWEATNVSPSEEEILRGIVKKTSEARQRLASMIWSHPVRDLLHQCAAFGVVSSHQVYVLTEMEESQVKDRLLREFPVTPPQCESILLSERVRVFIRFETLGGAFKAADAMSQSSTLWKVCFFPSVEYDQGHLGPTRNECWSRVPPFV